MLISLFGTALAWNLFTWWFGIPNSSSHCVIGALIGIAIGDALLHTRSLGNSVDWSQIWKILRALAISPLLGLIGAGGLYFVVRHLIKDPELYQPPQGDRPTRGWVRGLLILTCTGVSFSHGSNDGQKSIGLIMLTIIGILPATFALAPDSATQISQISHNATIAAPLITQYDHDGLHDEAIASVTRLTQTNPDTLSPPSCAPTSMKWWPGSRPLLPIRKPRPMTGHRQDPQQPDPPCCGIRTMGGYACSARCAWVSAP
ncbi:inorganic phosphate transporter [Komagataeibacter medellinensis]|uniref:inorganic phosphate transporter n=1 Tax=Komagataeibacter medellinensis TaxID=1177712 RepID=UPI00225E2AE0|nr:inorganic phosphate transporter [Komagataeibacter medellinensis]